MTVPWPREKQLENILRKTPTSYDSEIVVILERYLSVYSKANVNALNAHIHSLCQKKTLEESLSYVAVYCVKFMAFFEEYGNSKKCTPEWMFEDLAIRFRYSENSRDFDIYSYFSENCLYVPLMKFTPSMPKSSLHLEYVSFLCARFIDIQRNLFKQDDSPVLNFLVSSEQPIIYRQIIFEDKKNFANYCLFVFKNGKVMPTLKFLKYLFLCRSNKVFEECIIADAIHLALALLVCGDVGINLLEKGRKIEKECRRIEKKKNL